MRRLLLLVPLALAALVAPSSSHAALSVSDPGHLTNASSSDDDERLPVAAPRASGGKGSFMLPQRLQVDIAPATWSGPVSHARSTIAFKQPIGANDPLRTGTYSRTLTFTLSTTNP